MLFTEPQFSFDVVPAVWRDLTDALVVWRYRTHAVQQVEASWISFFYGVI